MYERGILFLLGALNEAEGGVRQSTAADERRNERSRETVTNGTNPQLLPGKVKGSQEHQIN